MPISNRLAFGHCSTSNGLSSRTALYGPVRRVVWQGSVGDGRPYADQLRLPETCRKRLIDQNQKNRIRKRLTVQVTGLAVACVHAQV